jgi:hypothetical protein
MGLNTCRYPKNVEHFIPLRVRRGLGFRVRARLRRALRFANGRGRNLWRDDRETRNERAYDARAFDVLDDQVPALHGQPFVTVAQT